MVKEISPQEFKEKVDNPSPDVICIDVRTGGEHKDLRIPGVVNIPLEELGEHIEDLRKHKEVYVHCASGNRSRMACEILTKAGLDNVCNVAGGIAQWHAEGLPTVCKKDGKRAQMPLVRQVMVVAGVLVLIGVALGMWAHPGFYGLAAFVGAGLLYGGASGNCLMMKLLVHAPWNKTCR